MTGEKTEAVTFDKYRLKDLWDEFRDSTGLHAVDKIKPPSFRPFSIRGSIWMIALCSTTAFLVYNLIDQIGTYYSYPTITKFTPRMMPVIDFPAVTICNRCTLNKTRLDAYPEMENYFFNRSKGFVDASSFPVSDIFQEQLSLEWWRNMSMEGAKMLLSCVFGGVEFDCMSRFRPVFTTEGLCHTFNFNDSDIAQVKKAGDSKNLMVFLNINQDHYTFTANLAAGIKVFLHSPSVHPDSGSSIVMAAPGFSTYVSMQKYEYLYQPLPYLAFGHEGCVETSSPDFVNPLKYYSPYTFNHCVMECVQTKAFNQCGCVGPSDPRGGRLCSLSKWDRCYKPVHDNESSKANFLEECGCVGECRFDSYTAQVSSSSFPAKVWVDHFLKTGGVPDKESMSENLVVLRVFYDQMMVTTITQQPQYTAASLFSNIGGQMGLCLGASILTVAEITEFLVFIILFLWDIFRGRKTRNRISNW